LSSGNGKLQNVSGLERLNLVKHDYGGLFLGLSQFFVISTAASKILLSSEVVKSDLKIIISLL